MGIFWECWIRAGTPETHLQPDNTRLAHALQKLGLAYNTVDFTEANNRLWQTTRRVLEEIGADLEAEGNTIIYETTMEETNRMDRRAGCRYLYLATTEGTKSCVVRRGASVAPQKHNVSVQASYE